MVVPSYCVVLGELDVLMKNSEIIMEDILRREENKMKALRGRVIVTDLDESKVSDGGIIIPDTHNEKKMMGVVVDSAIGDVKKGDILVYGRYAGTEIDFDDKSYRRLGGDDILAISPDGTLKNLSPVSDFLVVEPVNAPTETRSGIWTGGEKREADDYTWAKVLKVGPGRFTVKGIQIKPTVEGGNEVMYAPYQAFQLKSRDVTLVMIRESQLEAVRS